MCNEHILLAEVSDKWDTQKVCVFKIRLVALGGCKLCKVPRRRIILSRLMGDFFIGEIICKAFQILDGECSQLVDVDVVAPAVDGTVLDILCPYGESLRNFSDRLET